MFGSKYLLLELDKTEADFYHLPVYAPYLKKHQTNLKEFGFEWDLAVAAMQSLIAEMDVEEYKPYKLFIRKWPFYKELTKDIKDENWLGAEKLIDKILSIDLLDPSAYLNLGFIFRQMQQFQKAEQAYYKGLELLPDSVPFISGMARNYDEWGKKSEAIDSWKKVMELSEDHSEALEMLEKHKVLIKIEKTDPRTKEISCSYVPTEKYEALMLKELAACGDNIDALTQLGLRLTKNSQSKLALKVFARVYELTKSSNAAAAEKNKPLSHNCKQKVLTPRTRSF